MNDQTDPRRYAIYAYVSSSGQDAGLSVSAQSKALEEYAREHDGVVTRSYTDEAKSGQARFAEMIADVLRNDWPADEVLIWTYSCLGATRRDAIVRKNVLRASGIKVTAIGEPATGEPGVGTLMEELMKQLDEFFGETCGEVCDG